MGVNLTAQNGREGERMFKQINVRIEGLPIEEAGVEHVLRGIRDSSVVSIYNQVGLFFLLSLFLLCLCID